MGMLDITLSEEDQTTATWVGVGAVIAGPVGAGAGYLMSEQVNKQNRMQAEAIEAQKINVEQARYNSLLRQVSAEIQADQSMLATLDDRSNNKGNVGINTQQNQQVGSSTSGTF